MSASVKREYFPVEYRCAASEFCAKQYSKDASSQSNKKQKNSMASSSSTAFPTGYTFATTEEDAARAKRAQRFEREHQIEASKGSSPVLGDGFVPRTVRGDIFSSGSGMGLSMGNGKGRSLGNRMGLFEAEIDPVSEDRDSTLSGSKD